MIGGTSESRELARALAESKIPCLVSVTTEAALPLYPRDPLIAVWVGKISAAQIKHFCQEQAIAAILDASHPFAGEISQLAIATAAEFSLPYLRYERPHSANFSSSTITSSIITSSTINGANQLKSPSVLYLDSFKTLVAGDYLTGHRVLLTIGYRHLSLFHPWQKHCTLFARILPSHTALQAALDAGFTSNRILAIRPPIALELERSLWQHWQISLLVTKASGQAGGEHIKRQLATELNVQLIIIKRPHIDYPQQTNNLSVSINFCRQAVI